MSPLREGGTELGGTGALAIAGRATALRTPRLIRAGCGVIAASAVALAILGVTSTSARREAVESVRDDAAPLLVAAQGFYVALADADAASAMAFLQAGQEPTSLRTRYLDDIGRAARELASIGEKAESSAQVAEAVVSLSESLPRYAALMESARTNNRLEFTVGAAYLRRASDLLREEMLPAATEIYEHAARDLDRGYREATSSESALGIGLSASVLLAALVVLQVVLAVRVRRTFNLGLITATGVVIVVTVWSASGLSSQHAALSESVRRGADPLLTASTVRILALRSLADINLDLIERGTEEKHDADFAHVTTLIDAGDGASGLLLDLEEAGSDIGGIRELYETYLRQHERIEARAGEEDHHGAVAIATGDLPRAAAALDAAFETTAASARRGLDLRADDAARWLQPLPWVLLIGVTIAVVAATGGALPRLREYR